GVLGGLDDDGAARGEGGRGLGDDLVQRVVPGRDGPDHAHRLAQHGRVADPLLERVRGRQFGVGTGDGDGDAGVHGLRQLQGGAQFGGDRLGDPLPAGPEGAPQGGEPGGALRGRGGAPRGEGGAGRPDGGVDVLHGARRDGGDHLFVGRVHDLDHVRTGGGAPGAVDVHAVVCLHRASSGRGRRVRGLPPHKLAVVIYGRQGNPPDGR